MKRDNVRETLEDGVTIGGPLAAVVYHAIGGVLRCVEHGEDVEIDITGNLFRMIDGVESPELICDTCGQDVAPVAFRLLSEIRSLRHGPFSIRLVQLRHEIGEGGDVIARPSLHGEERRSFNRTRHKDPAQVERPGSFYFGG